MNGIREASERFRPSDNPELGPVSHEWAHLEIDFGGCNRRKLRMPVVYLRQCTIVP